MTSSKKLSSLTLFLFALLSAIEMFFAYNGILIRAGSGEELYILLIEIVVNLLLPIVSAILGVIVSKRDNNYAPIVLITLFVILLGINIYSLIFLCLIFCKYRANDENLEYFWFIPGLIATIFYGVSFVSKFIYLIKSILDNFRLQFLLHSILNLLIFILIPLIYFSLGNYYINDIKSKKDKNILQIFKEFFIFLWTVIKRIWKKVLVIVIVVVLLVLSISLLKQCDGPSNGSGGNDICARCGGSGMVNEGFLDFTTCPVCHGTGRPPL